MKIGVSSYSFAHYQRDTHASYLKLCDLAREIGFDGIEFIDLDPEYQPTADLCALADEIRAHCEAIGLPIIAYTVGADFIENPDMVAQLKAKIDVAEHLGAKVVTLSGPDGYIYDEEGVSSSEEKVNYLLEMRASGRNRVQDYADKFGVPFFPGEKPWGVKADVIMPSAMQNDVNMESAQKIVANGVKYYIEVANMPTTNDALYYLMSQKNMVVAPSKAVNAGGVGVSALEMSQNSERLVWTAEEVDAQLHKMMVNIHKVSAEAAEEYGLGYNLVAGANIAGFQKVANAMMEQGIF